MSQTQTIAIEMLKEKFDGAFLLTKKQTAKAIGGVSTATLDRLTKDGAIPSKRVGGQVFYKIDDIAIYITSTEG